MSAEEIADVLETLANELRSAHPNLEEVQAQLVDSSNDVAVLLRDSPAAIASRRSAVWSRS